MSSEVHEAETVRIPVDRLYVDSLHTTPVSRDWGEGYGETWESFEAPSCPECGDYARWIDGAWYCETRHDDEDAKTLAEFVAEHRAEIDEAINAALFRYDGNGGAGTVPDPPPSRDDEEREQWIQNDESLYNWARAEGVLDEDWRPSDGEEIDPFEGGAEGPMMNYYYPLEDLGQASDVYDAADRIRDLPLCIVDFDNSDGGYALALTGGGMDLSWEICEAFTRLGFLPPLHFCDLPRMAGYPRGESDLYVISACRRSAEAAQYQAGEVLKRLAGFLINPND